MSATKALPHGGQLAQIAKRYNIAPEKWLDLSTGIAPVSYPIPDIPARFFQELPQDNYQLLAAAANYYQCQQLMVTNGSQAVIKALPNLWREKVRSAQANQAQQVKVFIPQEGYKEHLRAWQQAGFAIHFYQQLPSAALTENSVVVVINPNNPTGQYFNKPALLALHQQLSQLNGLLVVDEAFADSQPVSQSMATEVNQTSDNLLILKSFGKFYGLAGIRIGFALLSEKWRQALTLLIGPWQVNGPAQFIASQALKDTSWQQQQIATLNQLSKQLRACLVDNIASESIKEIVGTSLFQTVYFKDKIEVENLFHQLCQRAIYVRLTDEQHALRFGLAKAEQLPRLATAIAGIEVLS